MKKRILSIFLILALAFGILPQAASFVGRDLSVYAAGTIKFKDIEGHWAKDYVVRAINYGIVNGYDNGTFKPDASVTRAEFCTMVNNAFKNLATDDISYSDVISWEWYYDNIAKGVRAIYVQGYEDGTFRPNRTISRQEAAVIATRLVPYTTSTKSLFQYEDSYLIQDWAYAAVQKVLAAKYMTPRSDGLLHPESPLTRAEAVKIICDIIDNRNIKIEKELVTIKNKSTTLSNTIYTNGLTIDKNVGEGKITIKNCVILGTLTIKGGGTNSIYLKDTRVANCVVDKSGSEVRVLAEDNTFIKDTIVKNKAILEEKDMPLAVADSGFSHIEIAENGLATLREGSFPTVNIAGNAGSLILDASLVNDLDISKEAMSSTITLDKSSRIISANANADAAFFGDGKISALYVNADNVTYETRPAQLFVGEKIEKAPTKLGDDLAIVINPVNEAKDIPLDKVITLTFNRPVKYYNGKTLTPAMLSDLINFTAKKANGTAVPFTAKINSNDTIITITPTDGLVKKTKYYISIAEAELLDEEEEVYNLPFSSMFTTNDGSIEGVTWKPLNNSSGASKTLKPSISFAETIEAYDGKTEITPTYLKRHFVFRELDENIDEEEYEENGKAVTFTAEINKKLKGITITPKTQLEDGKTYYLAMKNNSFRYKESGIPIDAQYIVFTVGHILPEPTFTPKDGTQFFDNDDDIKIVFNDTIGDSAGKPLDSEYIKNNITFGNNTAGGTVAYSATVSTSKKKTTITLDPVSLLPDGNEFTIVIPDGKFKSSNNKAIGRFTTSFTSAYTIPKLTGLSASASTSKVTCTLKANMNATAYLKVVPASQTLTTVAQVKNGATSAKTSEGETSTVTINGTYVGGDSYKVYAIMETASGKVTDISSATFTVTRDVASASRITVSSNDGNGYSSSQNVRDDSTGFTYTLPYGTRNAKISVAVPSGKTVAFDTSGGNSFTSGTVSGSESYVNLSSIDGSRDRIVKVKVSANNNTDSIYTVTLKVAGNTDVASVDIAGSIGTTSGGKAYILPSSMTSTTVTIRAVDPNATITCQKLSPSSATTGSLAGTMTIPTGTSTTPLEISYTIKSNQETETYSFTVQALE